MGDRLDVGPGPQLLLWTVRYHMAGVSSASVSHRPGPCNRGLRGKNYYQPILQMRKSRLGQLFRALLIPGCCWVALGLLPAQLSEL